jgi:hypothetical protein
VRVNTAPGTFFVKDNRIVTTGLPNGFLRTEKMYENFILEMEWMHLKPKGNSGLFVWADALPAVGSPFTRSIEVQILDGVETKDYTSDGDVFSIWGAKLTPDRPHPSKWERCLPSEKRSKPAGQWNHYRVECRDGRLTLAVNGKVVSGGSKCRPRKGYLALEAEGSECHFRNLRIKELPTTNPRPEEVARAGQGHVSLFTGLDLSGWKAGEVEKSFWRAFPGPNQLQCQVKGLTTSLSTSKSFANFELVCDCKVPAGGSAAVRLRGSDKARLPLAAAPGGRWHRYVFTLRGGELGVVVDGKPGEKKKLPGLPARGSITLEADGAVTFANLFVRELE